MKKICSFTLVAIFLVSSVLTFNTLAVETDTILSGFTSNKTNNVDVIDLPQARASTTFTVPAGEVRYVSMGKCNGVSYSLSYTPTNVTVFHGIDSDKDGNSVLVSNSSSNGSGSGRYSGNYGQKYVYVLNDSSSRSIEVTLTYTATSNARSK